MNAIMFFGKNKVISFMKKILFVCSHFYSGSASLCESLNQHPKIQQYQLSNINPYSCPTDLLLLTEQYHKCNNRSAIYMEELNKNIDLTTKAAYKKCKFIYVIREPKPVLNFLIGNDKMKPSFATRYYLFRLRRLCEMAKRTPNAILLTWEDLITGRCNSWIENYLSLKQLMQPFDLDRFKKSFSTDLAGLDLISEAENGYEKYLYFLKKQNLQYWT
jgi:hypothetical protein